MSDLFAYQAPARSQLEYLESDSRGVTEFRFFSPMGGMVTGRAVLAGDSSKRPLVIFLQPAERHVDRQLDEALHVAEQGFAIAVLDSPTARPEPWRAEEDHAAKNHNRDILRQYVVDVRRFIDLIFDDPRIHNERISIVGKNMGGGVAAILSDVEHRAGCFVIQAAIPELGKFWVHADHPVAAGVRAKIDSARLTEHAEETAVTDALNHVGARPDKSVLYQWGRHDDWLTEEQAEAMVAQTTGDVSSLWYAEGHNLLSTEVLEDCTRWLREQTIR